MRALYQNGHAITALAQNIEYTATSGGPFWQSGVAVTPNTTNTQQITVDVEPGTINVEITNNAGETVRKNVSIGEQSVTLSAVPDDPDTEVGRIDVIYVTENGAAAVEGEVAPKRPTQASPFNDDIEGDFPGIWSPAPNDGSLVPGVARAIVHVTPQVSDSTDLTDADIVNFDAQGSATSAIGRDELRPAIEALDTDPNYLDVDVTNAGHVGNTTANQLRRNYFTVELPGEFTTIPAASGGSPGEISTGVVVPPDHRFTLWRFSMAERQGPTVENDLTVQIVREAASGASVAVYESTGQAFDYAESTGSIASTAAANDARVFTFRVLNSNQADSTGEYNATFVCGLEDTTR